MCAVKRAYSAFFSSVEFEAVISKSPKLPPPVHTGLTNRSQALCLSIQGGIRAALSFCPLFLPELNLVFLVTQGSWIS